MRNPCELITVNVRVSVDLDKIYELELLPDEVKDKDFIEILVEDLIRDDLRNIDFNIHNINIL